MKHAGHTLQCERCLFLEPLRSENRRLQQLVKQLTTRINSLENPSASLNN